MQTSTSVSGGCGSGACGCASTPETLTTYPVPTINGIALFEQGQNPPAEAVQELAYAELLRQEAVKAGLLPRHKGLVAPELTDAERLIVETMVDGAVATPLPTADECQRYFDANKAQFVVGQALHVRHILFAVTPGVNVHALSQHAEKALLELSRKDVAEGRFVELAKELSNCPSSTEGGDLGWLTPEACAPELANELFFQTDSRWGMGVHPRLVHTRFGLHIIEVLGRRKGTLPAYEEVATGIRQRLQHQSRATALRQYMQLLVGQAKVEGIELEGATSPLVQ